MMFFTPFAGALPDLENQTLPSMKKSLKWAWHMEHVHYVLYDLCQRLPALLGRGCFQTK